MWHWVVPLALAQANCQPDETCNQHRIDAFGSLAAYDVARLELYNASGCSVACINQCTCVCNTSGLVFQDLSQVPPPYCQQSIVCQNKIIQAMMNYDAEGYACENVTTIALASVYQLCATVKGTCANGACSAAWCCDSVPPIGEQAVGIPTAVRIGRWLIIVLGIVFFVFAISSTVYMAPTVTKRALLDGPTEATPLMPQADPKPQSASRKRTTHENFTSAYM